MSKGPAPRRYVVASVVAEAREKHAAIEIETEDGQVFTIDPPQLWSDRAMDVKVGPEDTAREVMGDEQYERYRAAGGTLAVFNLVLTKLAEDQGATVPES